MILFDQTGKIGQLKHNLELITNKNEYKSILILACEGNKFVPAQIDPIIQNISIPIFGGIFPNVIYKKHVYTKGTILIGIKNKTDFHVLNISNDKDNDFDDILSKKIHLETEARTLFVFVDAFANRISELIESMFNVIGLEHNYIGGGAGSLAKMSSSPCIFTPDGLLEQAAIIVTTDIISSISVQHGWEHISNPLHVTSSHNQTVKTLDWENAFEVYKHYIKDHSGKDISKENFFDIAKQYPFGISKIESEYIIRDPINVTDKGEIVCVGDVPENSFVYIMHGKKHNLVKAAKNAKHTAQANFPENTEFNTVLFIDCISRSLFLGDDFEDELSAVYDLNKSFIGILSIGEIANSGKSFLEFYNKTSVIGVMKL